jgi:dephospho-CoA kinase
MKLIGITGGVASGKSSVLEILRQLGARVLDADSVARDVRENDPEVRNSIEKAFGTSKPEELRRLIFGASPAQVQARLALERILHPAIQKRSTEIFERWRKDGARYGFYEAALLIEAGRTQDFQEIWVVQAPKEKREEWQKSRDKKHGKSPAPILESQSSDDLKRQHATLILENRGTLKDLTDLVKIQLERLEKETLG